MPEQPIEFATIFADARKGNFLNLEKMDNASLSKVARLIYADETLLWLSIRYRKWDLAYKLVLCGADIGFTMKSGKHRGASILSETTTFLKHMQSGLFNEPEPNEMWEIEQLLPAIQLLLAARGHVLSRTEKFDMSLFNKPLTTSIVDQYQTLMEKLAALFPTDSKTNFLAKMPTAVQFTISRFIYPEWSTISKPLLSCVHAELNKRDKPKRLTMT